jgi:hypothetical protein
MADPQTEVQNLFPRKPVREVLDNLATFFVGQTQTSEVGKVIQSYQIQLDGFHTVLQHAFDNASQFGIRTPQKVLEIAREMAGNFSSIQDSQMAMPNTIFVDLPSLEANLPQGKTIIDLLQAMSIQDQNGVPITSREQLQNLPIQEGVRYSDTGNAWRRLSHYPNVNNYEFRVPNSGVGISLSEQGKGDSVKLLIRPFLSAGYYAVHPGELASGEPIGNK